MAVIGEISKSFIDANVAAFRQKQEATLPASKKALPVALVVKQEDVPEVQAPAQKAKKPAPSKPVPATAED